MKRAGMVAILVTVFGMTLGLASASKGASGDEMIKAADALDQAFVAAFNRGDADALAGLFWNSPDAVLFPPDTFQERGIAAIRAGSAQMLAAMKGAKLQLTESHQMPAGDVVIGWGLWHLTMSGPDGAPAEMAGRYTDVKAKRDGKWVYLLDHASVPLPPPPAAK